MGYPTAQSSAVEHKPPQERTTTYGSGAPLGGCIQLSDPILARAATLEFNIGERGCSRISNWRVHSELHTISGCTYNKIHCITSPSPTRSGAVSALTSQTDRTPRPFIWHFVLCHPHTHPGDSPQSYVPVIPCSGSGSGTCHNPFLIPILPLLILCDSNLASD